VSAAMMRARAKAIFSDFDYKLDEAACSCNCCIVEARRPSEVQGNLTTKCSMPPPNDERHEIYKCPNQCSTVNDEVIGNSHLLHFERFCFYHCKPSSDVPPDVKISSLIQNNEDAEYNGGSILDATCVPIPAPVLRSLVTTDMNGRDPQIGFKVPAPNTGNETLTLPALNETVNGTTPKKIFG